MFDDLPPDLERLRTLRAWHAMWLARIDGKIAQLIQRQTEQERGRRAKPTPPEWIVELGIGVGRPPVQVHRGTCYMAGKRHRPVGREEARRLLADGTSACSHCRPDTSLGIIGLATHGIGR
ncbi:DUF6233 domain-containing protein [Streptomyces sp. Go40/10]|uniref:DUF6233 domain-containing protein n=1 Tax=Streptomyces sp. Go40/10 TaxID=2825844 RepID=UPI001E38C2B0|nr:DUF6233 domain-containing protein [Streptomyces sp. Go40/10]UFR07155.1 DUF6233 domain-containing protein [Streptomyces sp. Go40/10]